MNPMDEMGMEMPKMITMPLCDRTVTAEVSGDYTLPDYQPEIRRLLCVEPTVLPPAKYVGGGNAELNGTVDYQILYVGGDGGLYTAPLSAEYSMNVPLESVSAFEMGEGVNTLATTVCENVSTRVTAPRKLNIRSRLRSHVRVYGKQEMETRLEGVSDPSALQYLRREGRNMCISGGMSDVIGMSEEIGGISEDARVISANGCVFVADVRRGDGMVTASGDVNLKMLLAYENGETELLNRKIPFEGDVEIGEMPDGFDCCVLGTVSDISVSMEEGKILCDIGVLLEARCMCNMPVPYIADVYSTVQSGECSFEEYRMPIAQTCINGNVSQSERIPLAELNLSEDMQIADVKGSVRFDNCTAVGDKYVLTGESRYVLICQKDGEYSAMEWTVPLRYETDGAEGDPFSFDAAGQVISCRAKTDGSNLNLDAEIAVVADFSNTDTLRAVSEARFGENYDCRGERIVVYYPTERDTPWSVAKQYRISPEKLTDMGAYYLL